MADGVKSGLSSGTNGAPQTSFENNELQIKSRENEATLEEQSTYNHDVVINAFNSNDLDFMRNNLSKSSPITIPHTAEITPTHKNGYEQISYKWNDGKYKFESRWHTHTPKAPEHSNDTWVVTRTLPGIPAGKNHHKKEVTYLVKSRGWVSSDEWDKAKLLRKANKETEESRRLLDNGHWNAEK